MFDEGLGTLAKEFVAFPAVADFFRPGVEGSELVFVILEGVVKTGTVGKDS